MPIIYHTSGGQQFFGRGEHLGAWTRILLMLRLPVTVRSIFSEDVHTIPAQSIAHIQAFTDDEFERRKAMQAEARKRNPNPGPQPKRVMPRGKP